MIDEELNKKLDILIKNTRPVSSWKRIWISFSNGLSYALGSLFATAFIAGVAWYLFTSSPLYKLFEPYIQQSGTK